MNKHFNKSEISIMEKESKSIRALNVQWKKKQANNLGIIWN